MRLFYVDSSAWVKRHQKELGPEWLARFWRPSIRFCCVDLGLIEVLCTVVRRHTANRVDEAVTQEVFKTVRRDFEAFTQVTLDPTVLRLAELLAQRRRLRGADCIHLASAIQVRESQYTAVTLIASDTELLNAASAEGFPVLDPASNPAIPVVE